MRRVTGAIFLSVDGVMQAPGSPDEDPSGDFRLGGWSFHYWDESLEQAFRDVIEAEYDLLLGKRTYEIFAGYWPEHQETPIGERFQRINKYVLTHSLEPLAWEHSETVSGDTARAVAGLKQTQGRDLLIQGSSTLYPPLLSAGLIDRLVLIIFPVILGRGKRLFDSSEPPGALRLKRHSVSSKGVVVLHYEPSGPVPTGSFSSGETGEVRPHASASMEANGR